MLDDIELDEVQVVEVTGKRYRDKPRNSRRRVSCECTSSLRLTTLLIVASIALVVIVFLCIGIILMFDSLESLDVRYSNTSVNRLAMVVLGDLEKMRRYTMLNAFSAFSGWTLRNYSLYKDGKISEQAFLYSLGNFTSTQVYIDMSAMGMGMDMGGASGPQWQTGSENNYIGLFDTDFKVVPGGDFFHPGDENALCGQTPAPPPKFKPQSFKNIVSVSPDDGVWMSLYVPDSGDTRPMMLTFVEVKVLGEDDPNVYGYLAYGRSLFPRLNNGGSYVDDVPTCITIEDGKEDAEKWDKEDKEGFDEVTPGTFALGGEAYLGKASFKKRSNATISATSGRICPSVQLFNSTSTLMVGYMRLCGLDPKKFGEQSCVKIRVDRPTSFYEEGTAPVIHVSLLVVGLMIVICIIFVFFLDCVVLRRIESLSKVIRSQTRGHAKAQEEEDESSISSVKAVEKEQKETGKHGKSGKSSKNRSGTSASGTSATSDSSATNASGPTRTHGAAHDEIGNLKRDLQQNAAGLRSRLESVNDAIRVEQQKSVHHKGAMQLLNLWCGRKDFFPGLRPNAMQLRYEPVRSLDDILDNPLALEYLKVHCDNDRTLENLWFILDVEWLQEVENAEDEEKDSEKRAQLHDVAECAAKNIIQRYIAKNAPQQINLSAATFAKLREVGDKYTRMMFREASNEVKFMLSSDILPRFQKTSSYSAMSETLYHDSAHGGESSSELSDETVSTAGSILSAEGEEEGGVGRIFAKTFKNLHTAFDAGREDSSSRSGSSARAVPATPDSEVKAGVKTPDQDESSSSESSSDSSEKEPPKISDNKKEAEKEEKKEEKEEKKEEKKEQTANKVDNKNESSALSSDSLSSDSLSASTSSLSSSSALTDESE